jgi:hypothetical protein
MSDFLLPPDLVAKAREVVEANRKAGRRVAVAESCTGGLVCAALTEIPGSSEVFEVGFVTYSNEAKTTELKVSEEVVETFGAVSIATAWAMAQGALEASEADIAFDRGAQKRVGDGMEDDVGIAVAGETLVMRHLDTAHHDRSFAGKGVDIEAHSGPHCHPRGLKRFRPLPVGWASELVEHRVSVDGDHL